MKILVPTDFSDPSKNAALYAAKFAKHTDAEIILMNVVHFEHPPMVQVVRLIENKVEEMLISEASKNCSLLVDELKSKVKGLEISSVVMTGFPIADAIEEFALTHHIDFIIMGTKGASDLEKVLFGSNAASVINKSSIPVITVPEHCRYNEVKRMVYASDMDKIEDKIKQIISIAKLFNASIDILHVQSAHAEKKDNLSTIEHELIKSGKYKNISVHIAHNDDVIKGINNYVIDVKADILAMYTHEMGFFESLFKTSYSREEAFKNSIPLLTLKM